MKFRNFLIIVAIVVVAVLAASWVGMSYSKEVLKLEILGPDKIDAGEQINYTVKFKNNGKVRLETPELYFEFPDGAILENTQKIVK
ncbi:MAG: hypothetical protein PHG23_03775, partial [Candidatus Pacebacteria bacterium]|nr:hypothetical protein [Candidatus Paceibacterota bacterium]